MKHLLFACFAATILSGCVPNETGLNLTQGTDVPVTQDPERQVEGGQTFTLGSPKVLASKPSGSLRNIERQSVTYAIGSTGKTVVLNVDGNVYNLDFNENEGRYKFADARNSAVALRIFAATNSLELIYATHSRLNAAGTSVSEASAFYQPIGFLSAPDVPDQLSGRATYSGELHIVSSAASTGPSFGKGNLALNVDFDTNKLSGGASLSNASTTNPRLVPITRIDIPETSFANGAASGAITVVTRDPTHNLANGEFGAAFYGSQAKGVGGTVNGEIKDAMGTTVHAFQGAFATSR